MIPKYRYDAVQARARQLAEELETLKAQLEKSGATAEEAQAAVTAVSDQVQQGGEGADELKRLAEEHAAAILEGDTAKAAELQAELISKAASLQSTPKVDPNEVVSQAVTQMQLQQVVEQLETQYPVLDPNSKEFDQDLNERVYAFFQGLVSTGRPPVDALVEAAETVMAASGKSPNSPVARRGLTDRAQAAANTPPVLSPEVGSTGTPPDVTPEQLENMTTDEWAALPESTRKKLLGIG